MNRLGGFAVPFFYILAVSSVAAAVTINPGDDIQTAVNNNPAGTTFNISAGTYRITTGIIPKSGDIFVGQPGAVINGSRLLTSWTASGNFWVTSTPTEQAPVGAGVCDTSKTTLCNYTDSVYYDNTMLWRVAALSQLAFGDVFVDTATNHVYLADNPSGHVVEQAVSTRAFRSIQLGITGVTLQGLIIEKFANEGQSDAVEGANWTIKNNEIRLNHGTGLGNGQLVVGNYVHHNGQMGIGGSFGTNVLIQNNEIAYNNTAGFSAGWEAGGTKWVHETSMTVTGNYAHDNNGPGLWTDTANIYITYVNNHTKNNAGPGIMHERSSDTVITSNLSEGDDTNSGGTSLWFGAGIYLHESSNVQIYGDTVTNSGNGIGGATQAPYTMLNVSVHDNWITQTSGTAAGMVADASGDFTQNNILFDRNIYCLPNTTGNSYAWSQGAITKAQWQADGQDVHGVWSCAGFPPPPNPCDLNSSGHVDVSDVQLAVNQATGTLPCTTANLQQTQPPTCNIVDVQRVVNAAMGGACVVGP